MSIDVQVFIESKEAPCYYTQNSEGGDKVTCFTVFRVLKDIVRGQQPRLLEHTGKDNKYKMVEPENKAIHSLTSSQRTADSWKIGRRFT